MAFDRNKYQIGYPVLIWLAKREMSLVELRISAYLNTFFHLYSDIESKISVTKTSPEEAIKWTKELSEIYTEFIELRKDYRAYFENPDMSEEEFKYRCRVMDLYRKLNILLAQTKIIDGISSDAIEVPSPLPGGDKLAGDD